MTNNKPSYDIYLEAFNLLFELTATCELNLDDLEPETIEILDRVNALDSKFKSDKVICPICGKMSHNPKDIAHKYCGYCHQFWGDEVSLK